MKEKNVKMADDLLGLQHSYADLNREYEEKTKAYEGLIQKQRAERDYIHRIKQDLSAANKELTMRVQERNTALLAERQWKNLYEDIKRDKQEVVKGLQDLQMQVNAIEHQVEEIMVICEERVNKERMLLLELEERHQAAMTRARDYMAKQEKDVIH